MCAVRSRCSNFNRVSFRETGCESCANDSITEISRDGLAAATAKTREEEAFRGGERPIAGRIRTESPHGGRVEVGRSAQKRQALGNRRRDGIEFDPGRSVAEPLERPGDDLLCTGTCTGGSLSRLPPRARVDPTRETRRITAGRDGEAIRIAKARSRRAPGMS